MGNAYNIPMNTNDYYMLSFRSAHDAMAWERALSGRVPARTMPTLRQVSVSCGISLRVEAAHRPLLEEFLRSPLRPRGEVLLFHVQDGAAAAITPS